MKEEMKVREEIFYADDGMVASTDPRWIHTKFDTLTGIFDWLGMKTNVWKTVVMVCHPCRAAGVQSDEAYNRKMTRAGRSYKERNRERAAAPIVVRNRRGGHWLRTANSSTLW